MTVTVTSWDGTVHSDAASREYAVAVEVDSVTGDTKVYYPAVLGDLFVLLSGRSSAESEIGELPSGRMFIWFHC